MKHTSSSFPDPALAHALLDEADIGSGERGPGDHETDLLIRQIPLLEASELDGSESDDADAALQDDAIEADLDVGAPGHKIEQDQSLERDEPDLQLDALDPVPPKGT